MKNKKSLKTIALILVILIVSLFSISSCSLTDTGFTVSKKVYINGYTYGGKINLETLEPKIAEGEYNLEFDSDWLTVSHNEEYNSGLATFSVLLSTDIYPEVYVAFDKSNADPLDNTRLLTETGFQNAEYYEVAGGETDADDCTALVLAHRTVRKSDTDYDVFIAVVSGTRNDVAEDWYSNFDVGSDDENYYGCTGEHPEWINKEYHKGFDVASNRVMDYIDKYIAEYKTEGNETHLLLTGHSRGGAIANILGARYEDDPDIYSYSYAVACPTTTTSAEKEYKTIFNLINTEDFVSIMPVPEWGFFRYGTDVTGTVSGYASEYNQLTGLTYAYPDVSELETAFAGVAENMDRADLYKEHEWILKTKEDFTELGPESIEELGVDNYFSLSWKSSENEKGKVAVEDDSAENGAERTYYSSYCNAFLLRAIADLIADRNDPGQIAADTIHTCALLELSGQDNEGDPLNDGFSAIVSNAAVLPWPHFTASYLILASHS